MGKATFRLVCGDVAAAQASLLTGFALRFGSLSELEALLGRAGEKVIFFTLVVLFSSHFCGLYEKDGQSSYLEHASRISVSTMLGFFLLSALYYICPWLFIGRGFLSLSLLFFGIFQFLSHRSLQAFGTIPGFNQRVLVLGTGPLAQTLSATLINARENIFFLGFVLPRGDEVTVPREEIVGEAEQIEEIVRDRRPQTLVIASPERCEGPLVRQILRCKVNGVEIVDGPGFFERLTGKLLIENIEPSRFVFSDGFRLTRLMRLTKRVMDIVLSVAGLLLTLPVLPVVAVAIRLDSRGPVLFRQLRIGQDDRPFTIYKFRTMKADAEKGTGAVWAAENDPRITRVGRFLRKSRLDELPQLFNVFKGEMSLVGPRPERPEFVGQLTEKIPFYAKRHLVKPGITGWAQICYRYGASDADAIEKLRYDLYYIKNFTLMFDLLITLETIKVVFYRRGGR